MICFTERTIGTPFSLEASPFRSGNPKKNVVGLDIDRFNRCTFPVTGLEIKSCDTSCTVC